MRKQKASPLAKATPGTLAAISHDELWRRCKAFLDDVLPVVLDWAMATPAAASRPIARAE